MTPRFLGITKEIETGKEIVKETMIDFEEKSQDGKEEFINFATTGAQSTRILGTKLRQQEGRWQRIKRGYWA